MLFKFKRARLVLKPKLANMSLMANGSIEVEFSSSRMSNNFIVKASESISLNCIGPLISDST